LTVLEGFKKKWHPNLFIFVSRVLELILVPCSAISKEEIDFKIWFDIQERFQEKLAPKFVYYIVKSLVIKSWFLGSNFEGGDAIIFPI
jgi:hypothetical protein